MKMVVPEDLVMGETAPLVVRPIKPNVTKTQLDDSLLLSSQDHEIRNHQALIHKILTNRTIG